MLKRGQVTIFIVLGILIILSVGVYFLLKLDAGKVNSNQEPTSPEHVSLFIESCIQSTAQNGILFVAKHGGYYHLPSSYDPDLFLPYYMIPEEKYVPRREEIEESLSQYVKENIPFCLGNFEFFQERGIEIQSEALSVTTTISSGEVLVQLNLPLDLVQGVNLQSLQQFSARVPSQLYDASQAAREFVVQEERALFCVSCLTNAALTYNMKAIATPTSDDTLMIDLYNLDFHYRFLMKYAFENRAEEEI